MTETRTVTVEREFSHPPEKLWRALTQPHLIQEWLMKNDFVLSLGHRFKLSGDWGHADCEVKEIDPPNTLSYSWDAMGLKSIVTFTLTATVLGTHLRMDQAGFPMDHEQAYRGAIWGWTGFLGKLDEVLGRNEAA